MDDANHFAHFLYRSNFIFNIILHYTQYFQIVMLSKTIGIITDFLNLLILLAFKLYFYEYIDIYRPTKKKINK